MEKKYPSHPPKSLVKYIVAISGMKIEEFEKFFGMAWHTMTNYLGNYNRPIPKKHWGIFFDPPESITNKTKEIAEAIGIKIEKQQELVEHTEEAVKEETRVKKIGVLSELLKN